MLDLFDRRMGKEPGTLIQHINFTDALPKEHGGMFQRINLDTPEFHAFFDGSKVSRKSSKIDNLNAGFGTAANGKFYVDTMHGRRLHDTMESAMREVDAMSAHSDDPLVMYHGSPSAGFESFDMSKMSDNGLYGPGIYLTEDPKIASGTGDTGWAGYAGREGYKEVPLHKRRSIVSSVRCESFRTERVRK